MNLEGIKKTPLLGLILTLVLIGAFLVYENGFNRQETSAEKYSYPDTRSRFIIPSSDKYTVFFSTDEDLNKIKISAYDVESQNNIDFNLDVNVNEFDSSKLKIFDEKGRIVFNPAQHDSIESIEKIKATLATTSDVIISKISATPNNNFILFIAYKDLCTDTDDPYCVYPKNNSSDFYIYVEKSGTIFQLDKAIKNFGEKISNIDFTAWSKDGRKLIIGDSNLLHEIDVVSKSYILTHRIPDSNGFSLLSRITFLKYSVSQNQILLKGHDGLDFYTQKLYLYDLSRSQIKELAADYENVDGGYGDILQWGWSPNEKYIAVIFNSDQGVRNEKPHLSVFNSDGKLLWTSKSKISVSFQENRLGSLNWSPDSKYFIFFYDPEKEFPDQGGLLSRGLAILPLDPINEVIVTSYIESFWPGTRQAILGWKSF